MLVWMIEVFMLHHNDVSHEAQTTSNIQINIIEIKSIIMFMLIRMIKVLCFTILMPIILMLNHIDVGHEAQTTSNIQT